MKKSHAHLQSYIKTCVKFQKDQPKTVRGVVLTKYLLHMLFNSVRGKKKKSKLKMQKWVWTLWPRPLTYWTQNQ